MAGNKAAFDAAMKRAQDYTFENAWEKALREYQRALEEFPTDPTAIANQAQALFRLQQWTPALAAYQTLLDLRPNDPFLLNRVAECYANLRQVAPAERTYMQVVAIYASQNQVREALAALRSLLELSPRHRQGRERLAELYRELGERTLASQQYLILSRQALEGPPEDLDLAVHQAEDAFNIDPNHPESRNWLYQLRRRQAETSGTQFDEATLRVTGHQKPGTGPDLQQMFNLALQYQEQGQFAAARVQFEAAAAAGLDSPALHYSLGLLYQQEGDLDAAIGRFKQSVADSEYAMSSYYALGICYRDLGEVLEATRAFESAVEQVNLLEVSRPEVTDLIELYESAAGANIAAGNLPRAASLYATLAGFLQTRRWQSGATERIAAQAQALSEEGLTNRLQSIGGPAPDPAPPPPFAAPPAIRAAGATVPQAAMTTGRTRQSAILRPITDFLRELQLRGPGAPPAAMQIPSGDGPATTSLATQMHLPELNGADLAGPPVDLSHLPAMVPAPGFATGLLADVGLPADPEVGALVDVIDRLIAEKLWMAAVDCCFEVIRLDPEYLPVHLRLAQIMHAQGRMEDAVAKLQSVIDTYLVRGELDHAVRVFEELIALQPDNINIRMRLISLFIDLSRPGSAVAQYLDLAELFYTSGQHERAMDELRRARTLAPQHVVVRARIGQYLLRDDKPEEALPEFSRALQVDPEYPAALVGVFVSMAILGNETEWDVLETMLGVAARLDRRREMEEQLRGFALTYSRPELEYARALVNDLPLPADEMDPADREALEQQQLHAQFDALDAGLRLLPAGDRSPLALLLRFRRAHLAVAQRDGARAVTLLGECLGLLDSGTPIRTSRPNLAFMKLPTHLDIYQPLAQAFVAQGDPGRAVECLQRAKAIAAYDRGIYTMLAELYFRQGQLGAALTALDELINHYQELGQLEKVIETLGYMARLAPNNITVRQKLADTYLKIGYLDRGLAELDALGDLQHKAGRVKDALHTYQRSADIYWQMGNFPQAFTIYDRIVRLAPFDVDTRQQLIHLYITSGQIAAAVSEQKVLADLFLKQKRSKEAIAALHELIALAPSDPEPYYALAEVLAAQDEFGQAARLYGRLRRLEPAKDAQLAALQTEMQRRAKESRPQPAGGR